MPDEKEEVSLSNLCGGAIRVQGGAVHLALFEADGTRWQIAAVAAIAAWLKPKFPKVPVIS